MVAPRHPHTLRRGAPAGGESVQGRGCRERSAPCRGLRGVSPRQTPYSLLKVMQGTRERHCITAGRDAASEALATPARSRYDAPKATTETSSRLPRSTESRPVAAKAASGPCEDPLERGAEPRQRTRPRRPASVIRLRGRRPHKAGGEQRWHHETPPRPRRVRLFCCPRCSRICGEWGVIVERIYSSQLAQHAGERVKHRGLGPPRAGVSAASASSSCATRAAWRRSCSTSASPTRSPDCTPSRSSRSKASSSRTRRRRRASRSMTR